MVPHVVGTFIFTSWSYLCHVFSLGLFISILHPIVATFQYMLFSSVMFDSAYNIDFQPLLWFLWLLYRSNSTRMLSTVVNPKYTLQVSLSPILLPLAQRAFFSVNKPDWWKRASCQAGSSSSLSLPGGWLCLRRVDRVFHTCCWEGDELRRNRNFRGAKMAVLTQSWTQRHTEWWTPILHWDPPSCNVLKQ